MAAGVFTLSLIRQFSCNPSRSRNFAYSRPSPLMSESHLSYPQQPFRIGVVGAGSMGKNHARIFGELKDSQLSAVLDERAEVAQEIAAKYHAQASANLDEF